VFHPHVLVEVPSCLCSEVPMVEDVHVCDVMFMN
jgi:hypothetical protein